MQWTVFWHHFLLPKVGKSRQLRLGPPWRGWNSLQLRLETKIQLFLNEILSWSGIQIVDPSCYHIIVRKPNSTQEYKYLFALIGPPETKISFQDSPPPPHPPSLPLPQSLRLMFIITQILTQIRSCSKYYNVRWTKWRDGQKSFEVKNLLKGQPSVEDSDGGKVSILQNSARFSSHCIAKQSADFFLARHAIHTFTADLICQPVSVNSDFTLNCFN